MNILVTGGLGHIGSKLIRDLALLNPDLIRIYDNFLTQRYSSLFNLPENTNYELIEGDIKDKSALNLALKDIDIVIHLAAITNAPNTFNIEEETKNVNLDGSINVIEACRSQNVSKIIFPSTTSVYGPTSGIAKEDCSIDDYKPQSPYAKYKLLAEKEFTKAYNDYGIDTAILRLGTIFGTSIGMRFHTAINKFVFQASMGQPITVWDGALDQKRPYLDLVDSIEAMKLFILKEKGNGEVFNVVTENYNVQQIVDELKTYFPQLNIIITKSPLLNQLSYFTDDSKIRKLGFSPKGNLSKSISETKSLFTGFIKQENSVKVQL